jgi:hypothetical protein
MVMNRAFLILSCLVLGLSAGAFFWLSADESVSAVTDVETRESTRAQNDAAATEQHDKPSNLTAEVQHLQIMELELDRAKAAVSRGKRRLAELEKSGRGGPDSLDARTTRDKLEADRKVVQQLKAAIKVQETAVATLKAATSRQQ